MMSFPQGLARALFCSPPIKYATWQCMLAAVYIMCIIYIIAGLKGVRETKTPSPDSPAHLAQHQQIRKIGRLIAIWLTYYTMAPFVKIYKWEIVQMFEVAVRWKVRTVYETTGSTKFRRRKISVSDWAAFGLSWNFRCRHTDVSRSHTLSQNRNPIIYGMRLGCSLLTDCYFTCNY